MPVGGQPAPPVFEQIFKNARFAQGGNALFEGRVRGNPKPTVSWTRQGRPIRDSNKYQLRYNQMSGEVSLLISHIGPGDEGEYTCMATNPYGEAVCTVYIQPEAAFLAAQQQQQQQQQQGMQRRMVGQHGVQYRQETTTTTDADGRSTTSTRVDERHYQMPYGEGDDFKVDTFEYRLIRETEFRESLTRRGPGETETETEVETETESRRPGPLSAPQVQAKPRATKLPEGADAAFVARLTGNPKPKVTWFKNGVRLRSDSRTTVTYATNLVTLKIRSVTSEDSGHYTMLAENAAGCVVSSAYLAVEPSMSAETRQQIASLQQQQRTTQVEEVHDGSAAAPTFLRVPTDKEVQEGKMVRFDCRTMGKPAPEVFWYINGTPVTNDITHKVLVNEAGSHALMITNVSQRDAGVVSCVAKNKSGETNFQVNLSVLEKAQVIAPKFVERFQTVHVRPGEPVSLSCRAVGAPTPLITWQKDGQPLEPGPNVRIITDGGASMLDIPCVRPEDAAWYQCTAQNAAGSTATRAKLYVDVGPAPPAGEPWRLHLPKPTKVIEPEAPQAPEVIHLRHVERSRPRPQPEEEEERPCVPPQFTYQLRDVQVREGDRALLEAKVTPLSDPTMHIEWYIDGKPLPASSRATTTYKFGYVSLSLLSVIQQDTGVYTCRAVNQAGSADSTCTVSVGPRATIETSTHHPESLGQIQQLEDTSRYVRSVSQEELATPPSFVRQLTDVIGVSEGGFAHFQAQIQPVSDPHMRVDWFKDGKPITAGSRISTINNFGYLALNISQLRREDSGVYTVRAANKAGEAVSQCQLTVTVREDVTGDLGIPEQQRHIQSVEQLEAYKQAIQQQVTSELVEKTTPPQFTQPIRDAPPVAENGTAHFEGRLEPMGDSTMRVEWFKDDKPLEASSRITTFFNFGYVSLTIKQVTVFDSGVYTCVGRNAAGEAQCQATLHCVGKKSIITESQVESVEKLQYLEDSSRHQRRIDEEETAVTKIPPKFLTPIKGTTVIREGQRAHFEARVEPQNDSTMKTEWYLNGKPLASANRIQTHHDFGYVAVDINGALPEDAGTYTLVASNALGQAQQQTQMRVEARSAIDSTSIHRGVVEKTDRMERSKFQEPHYDVGDYCKSKPVFTEPLRDPQPQPEGRGIHLECRLEPLNDPTMRVEWFFNGRPVTIGSRFRTYYDFGFVALDVLELTPSDCGEYTVRATNQLGSAHSSAQVRVLSRSDVLTESQHEAALEQIQQLEDAGRYQRQQDTDTAVNQVPTFTKPLRNIETVEGTNIHLECRLQPVGDNSMKVEWFVNDQPLKIGHRFRPAYDFDYVALDLLSVYPTDSGIYTCRATNRLGQAVTSASVRVIARKELYTDHPESLEQIQYIEDSSRYQRKEWADEMVQIKPKFLTQLKHQENMKESLTAHFEAKLEPVADANLRVEWLKDGKPITVGHRHRPLHDFGYVALDIVGVIEEDNGVYTCRATNNLGYDETSAILKCTSGRRVLTSSQHEAGLERLQQLEDRSRLAHTDLAEELTSQAPVFTTSLANITIKEGQRAHFESRLIPVSDHTMNVQWFHNGRPVKAGSRFVETNSFGFVALDIMYAYPEDAGTYTCKATNTLGEAVTQATLTCVSKGPIDRGTLHEQALDKLRHLEQKPRTATPQEEATTQAPVFTQPIRDVRLVEGQPLHFEARLIPVGDARLNVEWFKNGVPLQPANRITTLHDFGFVALDMKYTQEDDSGTYTCRATNELGQAATSATCIVQSKESLLLGTQHAGAMEKLQKLEDKSFTRTEIEETIVTQKPRYVIELTGPTSLVEGQSAHMEARIEPYPDADMQVEWFFNGKPLAIGHRYRTVNDFGFVALDVLSAYPEDSGEYTVKATNKLGTATSTINIQIQPRAALIQETQHPAAMEKISHLESDRRRLEPEEAVQHEKPNFGRPLRNAGLVEGQSCHLEATLTPVNDPNMKVEWFYNGRPIPQGHRFRTTYDFGFVALDILYTYPEDSGTYMCKATNLVGEAVTTCCVNVEGKPMSPPNWRSVRHTVESIEGRPVSGGGGGPVVIDGFMSNRRSDNLLVNSNETTNGQLNHFTNQLTNHETSFSSTNGEVLADANTLPTNTGVYYPFYNAECTYVERAKVPVQEDVQKTSQTKTEALRNSRLTDTRSGIPTTWDNDQPFPIPVAFNIRDLSLDQFKRMNDFFSSEPFFTSPDYFDRKDTKSAESESKSWTEGNTQFHSSTSKSESSSYMVSKKTTVSGGPVQAPATLPTVQDLSQTRTQALNSVTRSSENLNKLDTRTEHESRPARREVIADRVYRPQSMSIPRSASTDRFRTESRKEEGLLKRSRSIDGGETVIPVPVESDFGGTWPRRREARDAGRAPGMDLSRPSLMSSSVRSVSSAFSEERTSRSESVSRVCSSSSLNSDLNQSVERLTPRAPSVPRDWPSRPSSKADEEFRKLSERVEQKIRQVPVYMVPENYYDRKETQSSETYREGGAQTSVQQKQTTAAMAESTGPVTQQSADGRVTTESRSESRFISQSSKSETTTSEAPRPAPIQQPVWRPVPVETSTQKSGKTESTQSMVSKTEERTSVPRQQPVPVYQQVPTAQETSKTETSQSSVSQMYHKMSTRTPWAPEPKPASVLRPVEAPTHTTTKKEVSQSYMSKREESSALAEQPYVAPAPQPVQPLPEAPYLGERKTTASTTSYERAVTTEKKPPMVPRPIVQSPSQEDIARRSKLDELRMVRETRELATEKTPWTRPMVWKPQPLPSKTESVQRGTFHRTLETKSMTTEDVLPAPAPPEVPEPAEPRRRSIQTPREFVTPTRPAGPKPWTPTVRSSLDETRTRTEQVTKFDVSDVHRPVEFRPPAPKTTDVPVVQQTEQQQKMEHKFFQIVTKGEKETPEIPSPVPLPQPEYAEDVRKFHDQQATVTKTVETIKQESSPVRIPAPAPTQTEHQRKMEQKFYEKLVKTEEERKTEEAAVEVPTQPLPVDVTDTSDQQWQETRTVLSTKQETVSAPKLYRPAQPEPAPSFTQTEQQKRMEEKFVKKVTEHEIEKEAEAQKPVFEAPVSKPFAPVAAPKPCTSTEIHDVFDHKTWEETKAVKVTEEIKSVPEDILRPPPTMPQTEKLRTLEQKFHESVTKVEEQESHETAPAPAPAPQPVPVYIPSAEEVREQRTLETTRIETKQEESLPVPRPAPQPWLEPEQSPLFSQTKEQRRMEEKFMKKVTEQQDQMTEFVEEVQSHQPVYEIPQRRPCPVFEAPAPPQPEILRDYVDQRWEETKTVTETLEQPSPVQIPVPTPQQTEQQKRLEQEFFEKVERAKEEVMEAEAPTKIPVQPVPQGVPVVQETRSEWKDMKTVATTKHDQMPGPKPFRPVTGMDEAPKVVPVLPHVPVQTEQQKKLEERFFEKVTKTEEEETEAHIPLPVPVPQPEENREVREQRWHQTKSLTEKEEVPQPAWVQPEYQPQFIQSEQQKRLEEKFFKKVTEQKRETEEQIEGEVRQPPYEVPKLTQIVEVPSPQPREHREILEEHLHETKTFTEREEAPQQVQPVWTQPDYQPQFTQTEQRKRMEEKFLKKVSEERQDTEELPAYEAPKPVAAAPVPVPQPEEQRWEVVEQRWYKTKTIAGQKEQALEPVQPVWVQSEYQPQITQSEQQKRMEEKFLQKVTEQKQETEEVTEEEAQRPVHAIPKPIPIIEAPVLQPEKHREVREERWHKAKTVTEEKEEAPQPVQPVWVQPVYQSQITQSEQQKRMEEKFFQKVTEQKQETEEVTEAEAQRPVYAVPKPTPVLEVPVPQPEEHRDVREECWHETKTVTEKKEEAPQPVQPVWVQPEYQPQITQSEQQKRMEEKFFRKVTEQKHETEEVTEAEFKRPVYEAPKPISTIEMPAPKPQVERREERRQEFKKVTETKEEAPSAPYSVPPVRVHPEYQPQFTQSEQLKRMEEKFATKVTEQRDETEEKREAVPVYDIPKLVCQPIPLAETPVYQPEVSKSEEIEEKRWIETTTTTTTTVEEEVIPLPASLPTSAPAQREEVKKIEETFMKKVSKAEEKQKEIPQPVPVPHLQLRPHERKEVREERWHEAKTVTEKREEAPQSVQPVWVLPEYQPQFTQTDQQRLMEEKFMKKVTEQREEEASEQTPVVLMPAPQPEVTESQKVEEHSTVDTKSVTETKEDRIPHVQPVVATKQTKHQRKMEEKFFQKVEKSEEERKTEEQPAIPVPQPQPQPELTSVVREIHDRALKTVTEVKQEAAPASKHVQPVFYAPREAPAFTQTEQQRKMEGKFMKKVTEQGEERMTGGEEGPQYKVPVAPVPQPVQERTRYEEFQTITTQKTDESIQKPVLKQPEYRPVPQPASVKPVRQSEAQKRMEERFYQKVRESSEERPVSEEPLPKEQKRDTREQKQTKQEERYVYDYIRKPSIPDSVSDVSDSDASVKIRELETKPLQSQRFESYTSKTFIGPKISEPPIYHKIVLEEDEKKKKENIYETVIPYPKPFKPMPPTERLPPKPEPKRSPSPAEGVVRHVPSPKTARKVFPKPKDVPYPFDDSAHEIPSAPEVKPDFPPKASPVQSPKITRREVPKQISPKPIAPKVQPPVFAKPKPEGPVPMQPTYESPKFVTEVQPVGETVVTTEEARQYITETDQTRRRLEFRPVKPLIPAPVEQRPPVSQRPVVTQPEPQRATWQPTVPTKAFQPVSAPQPTQRVEQTVEESVIQRFEDIVDKTEKTTKEEEKRVFSPALAPSPIPAPKTKKNVKETSVEKEWKMETDVQAARPFALSFVAPKPYQPSTQVTKITDIIGKQTSEDTVTRHTPHVMPQPISQPVQPKKASQFFEKFETSASSTYESTSQSSVPTHRPPPAKPVLSPVLQRKAVTESLRKVTDESSRDISQTKIDRAERGELRAEQPVKPPSGPKAVVKPREVTEKAESSVFTKETVSSVQDTLPVRQQPPAPRLEQDIIQTAQETSQEMTHHHKVSPQPFQPLSSSPYVDRQQTFSHQRISETTKTGRRDVEEAEKKSAAYEHVVSQTPTKTSSKTVQEKIFQSMSQSSETSSQPAPLAAVTYEKPVAPVYAPVPRTVSKPQPQSQPELGPYEDKEQTFSHFCTTEKTETGQRSTETAEKRMQAKEHFTTESPTMKSSKTVEEKSFQSMSESSETSKQTWPQVPTAPVYVPRVEAPRPAPELQRQPQWGPFEDKQEAFSHFRTAEKTETGHRERETAEKKKEAKEHFVTESPTTKSSKTMEEKSFQTMSQSSETSKQTLPQAAPPIRQPIAPVYAPRVDASRKPQPETHLRPYEDKQETFSRFRTTEKTETGQRETETAEKRREARDHLITESPTIKSTKTVEEKSFQTMSHSSETSKRTIPQTPTPVEQLVAPVCAPRVEVPRSFPKAQPQLSKPQPLPVPVEDKQETFSHYRTTEKTEMGQRETETSEKRKQAKEHLVTQSPTMTSSKTLEEQSFQTMSSSHETSKQPVPPTVTPIRPVHKPHIEAPARPVPQTTHRQDSWKEMLDKVEESHTRQQQTQPPVPKPQPAAIPVPWTSEQERKTFEGMGRKEESTREQTSEYVIPVAVPTSPPVSFPVPTSPYQDKQETRTHTSSHKRTDTGHEYTESKSHAAQEVKHEMSELPSWAPQTIPAGRTETTTSQTSLYERLKKETSETFDGRGQVIPVVQAPERIIHVTPAPYLVRDAVDKSFERKRSESMKTFEEQAMTVSQTPEEKQIPVQLTTERLQPFMQKSEKKEETFMQKSDMEASKSFRDAFDQWPQPLEVPTLQPLDESSIEEQVRQSHRSQFERTSLMGREHPIPVQYSPVSEKRQTTQVEQAHSRHFEESSTQSGREHIVPVVQAPQYMPRPLQDQLQERKEMQQMSMFEKKTSQSGQEHVTPVQVAPQPDRYSRQERKETQQMSRLEEKTSRSEGEHVVPIQMSPFLERPFMTQEERSRLSQSQFNQLDKTTSQLDQQPFAPLPMPSFLEMGSVREDKQQQQQQSLISQLDRRYSLPGSGRVIPVQQQPYTDRQERVSRTSSSSSSAFRREQSSERRAHSAERVTPVVQYYPQQSGTSRTHQQTSSQRSLEDQTSFRRRLEDQVWQDQAQDVPRPSWAEDAARKESSMLQSMKSGFDDFSQRQIAPTTHFFAEDRRKDGASEYYHAAGYTSGSDYEQVEEPNRSRRRKRAGEEGRKADRKKEYFETEEMRPDGRYLVQKTVEESSQKEMKRNEHSETIRGTFPTTF